MSHMKTNVSPNAEGVESATRQRVNRWWSLPASVVVAIIVGVAGTAAVAAVAHAAGVSNTFTPLKTASYVGLIVLGVLGGVVGWQLVRSRASDPREVLRRLAPLVVLVSFAPDVAIGVSGAEHATWGGVAALVCAHVVVAAGAIASFSMFLPASSRAEK